MGRGEHFPLVRTSRIDNVAADCFSLPAYKTLFAASNVAAKHYIDREMLAARTFIEKEDRIIALLSPSCADFLVTLFAALRLGYGLLLLAYVHTTLRFQYHAYDEQTAKYASGDKASLWCNSVHPFDLPSNFTQPSTRSFG